MERHAVPQNIMEVEFKLFGALTVRQFGYLAAGLIIALVLYFTALPGLLKFVLIIFSVLLGLFLSLVRINGQNSSIWLTNFIVAMFTSQERVWKKTGVVPEVFQEQIKKTREETLQKVKKQGRIKASVAPLTKFESQVIVTDADREEEERLKEIAMQFETTDTPVKKGKKESNKVGVQIRGYVFDKQDKPVEGALVSINKEEGVFITEAVTDEKGYFDMKMMFEPGVYFAGISAAKLNFDYYKLRLKKTQDILYKFKAK